MSTSHKKEIRKVGVLTSGGDAPGMNAAIRAVVRTAIYNNLKAVGIYNGYEGLINGIYVDMDSHSVANIIQKGGTFLKSTRSVEFRTPEGRIKAHNQLMANKVDALVVIGGDGTFTGADIFCKEFNFPIVGIPGTIDNDLFGCDFAIGYDTAINTVVEAVDKVRDTASSHSRLFFIEVMGRDAGFIALRSGIACGAEAILIPETETYIDRLIARLEAGRRKNKSSGIIIVAEGDKAGGAFEIARQVKEKYDYFDTRVVVLGHVQRGGSPSCMDRVLASRLGHAAIEALLKGHTREMVGIINNEIAYTPFSKAIKYNKNVNKRLLQLAETLSI